MESIRERIKNNHQKIELCLQNYEFSFLDFFLVYSKEI
ncbi:unnamed protein product [Paramecium sonneborni]|uniref:Uncharacterized protein n=1 Tax=Paramecium sonneborni TaxID=65129 RepID=A0A8S1N363_9CILI|nr:unnamed protein product [Paramecium sonneborni]